ncbi:hypothetical protein K490DRAFT_60890 [Saccharata proteae CBS 121410]|uniref:RING-type domain-containing protein n=1 Tax=Saccharata proteae CBS 121410 TaxID=1314787 RepID=A0A9P4LZT2_9PEZI|nr:hypothetical protein K490DRAFT_60890 [Saccharata proteae CBS 121410]
MWYTYPAIWLGKNVEHGSTLDIPPPENCTTRAEYQNYRRAQASPDQGQKDIKTAEITPIAPIARWSRTETINIRERVEAVFPRIWTVTKTYNFDDAGLDVYAKLTASYDDATRSSLEHQIANVSKLPGTTKLGMLTCTVPGKGAIVIVARETDFVPRGEEQRPLKKTRAVFEFKLADWLNLGSDPKRWWWHNLEELRLRKNAEATLSFYETLNAQGLIIKEDIAWADSPYHGLMPESDDSQCPVCLEDYSDTIGCQRFSLRCRHVFCEDCIRTWLEENSTCPICRDASVRLRDLALVSISPPLELVPDFWEYRRMLFQRIVKVQSRRIRNSTRAYISPSVTIDSQSWLVTLRHIEAVEKNIWRESLSGVWIHRPEFKVGYRVVQDWIKLNGGREIQYQLLWHEIMFELKRDLALAERQSRGNREPIKERHDLFQHFVEWFKSNVLEVLIAMAYHRAMSPRQTRRHMHRSWRAAQVFLDAPVHLE